MTVLERSRAWTSEALASELGVTRQRIIRAADAGILRGFKLGASYRFRPDAVTPEAVARVLKDEAAAESLRCRQQVYFIAASTGPVKIGIAVNPEKRRLNLQTSYPYALSILALTPGGAAAERAYHARFAAHRLNGEWFERVPEIETEIRRLKA